MPKNSSKQGERKTVEVPVNPKPLQQNKGEKCVSDGLTYLLYPPQSKCVNCGRYWVTEQGTPLCKSVEINTVFPSLESEKEGIKCPYQDGRGFCVIPNCQYQHNEKRMVPHQFPVTPESEGCWEERFDTMIQGRLGGYGDQILYREKDIKSFIQKELSSAEKRAYANGKRDGMMYEAKYTENYIKESYERGKKEGVEECIEAIRKSNIENPRTGDFINLLNNLKKK